MPFPRSHLYLTIQWDSASWPDESGQFGFRLDQAVAATPAQMADLAVSLESIWESPTSWISNHYRLAEAKAALIGTDGRYPDGHVPEVHVFSPQPVGGVPTLIFPLQVASVASLTTGRPRGRAHRGRVYLPPIEDSLTLAGVNGTTPTLARANAVKNLINDINDIFPAGAVSVFSSEGAGVAYPVTGVEVGNRPDVQRRRAKNIPETYQSVAL